MHTQRQSSNRCRISNTYGKNILMPKGAEQFESHTFGGRLETIDELPGPYEAYRERPMLSTARMGGVGPGGMGLGGMGSSSSSSALGPTLSSYGVSGVSASASKPSGKMKLEPLDTDRTDRSAPGRVEGGRLKKRHQQIQELIKNQAYR